MTHWPLALLLAVAGTSAQAAGPIYRCGSTYSQTPCPGGTLLEASDPRTAAQRAEARRQAAAERNAARDMANERLSNEKKQNSEPAIASLGPTAAASAPDQGTGKNAGKDRTKRKTQSKEAKDEPFTAVVPGGKKP